jgi:hypothetical protein
VQAVAIVGLCVLAAVTYGILQDQVTAHLCVEYFTIGHPPIFGTDSPVLLAIGWGILATWWVGLLLGGALAVAAQVSERPRRDAGSLVRPVVVLMGIMAMCALSAGVVGYLLARGGVVALPEPLAALVPAEKHTVFIADFAAHVASYLAGAVGGLVVFVRVWRERGRLAAQRARSTSREWGSQ